MSERPKYHVSLGKELRERGEFEALAVIVGYEKQVADLEAKVERLRGLLQRAMTLLDAARPPRASGVCGQTMGPVDYWPGEREQLKQDIDKQGDGDE